MSFYIGLFVLFYGCTKTIVPPIYKPPVIISECADTAKNLNPLWQVPTSNDSSRGIAEVIINTGYGISFFNGETVGEIKCLDIKNGSRLWQNIGVTGTLWPSDAYSVYVKDQNLYYSSSWNTSKYDNAGNLIWISNPSGKSNLGHRSSLIGNSLYFNSGGENQFFDSITYMIRLNLTSRIYDTVFPFKRSEHFGYFGFAEPSAFHVNNNQDSVILFKFRAILPANNATRCVLHAYNLTKKRMEWTIDSLDNEGSADPPIIEGNKCYVQGLGTIFCIDANTGVVIWKAWCGGRLPAGSTMISYQDRLAVVTLDGRFICVDKATGGYIYNRKDARGGMQNFDMASPSEAVELNGIMYLYGGGYFYGIDLTTGNIVMKYLSPHRCAHSSAVFGYGGIAKDDALGLIFVEDQYYVMAVKAYR